MSGRRKWKPPPDVEVIVLDDSSSDEEQREEPKKEQPKRRRQAAWSGMRQLPLQLSQQTSSQQQQEQQPSQQAAAAAAEAAPALGAGAKSGVAALMRLGKPSTNGAASAAAPSSAPAAAAELWVGVHGPTSEADLVVHKKKVQEVQQWLEWQRSSLGRPGVGRVAVVTGPPGCGKSTVVHVLAGALGFEACEWQPPTPMLWNEYQHQAGSGIKYLSKLDAFEEFTLRAKLPALTLVKSQHAAASSSAGAGASAGQPSQQATQVRGQQGPSQARQAPPASQQQQQQQQGEAGARQRPKLLIVDDLPHAANPDQRARLAAALGDLARTTRFPLVVMVTESSGKAQQERGLSAAVGHQGLHKDLVAALEAAQAATISFNPITTANTAKALKAILQREKLALPDEQVLSIAEQAQGDLHNAISTLQFVCKGVKASAAAAPAARKGRGTKRKAATAPGAAGAAGSKGEQQQQQQQDVGFASRDSTLTMFHALGKLLYNKRVGGGAAQGEGSQQSEARPAKKKSSSSKAAAAAAAGPSGGSSSSMCFEAPHMAAQYLREPLDFDPEAVLARSGLDAGSVAAYLQENLHNFVDAPAIDDMAGCLAYLSDADCIASSFKFGGGGMTLMDDELPSSSLANAAAASVAARGVCFANAHPAPRRWLPLSAPVVFTAERGARQNREQLERRVAGAWAVAGGARHVEGLRSLACERLPLARAMHSYTGDPQLLQLQPGRWLRVWEGQLHDMAFSGPGTAGQGGSGSWGWGGGGGGGEALLEAGEGEGGGQGEQDAIEESEDEDDW